jgi:hypothetical protein
MNDIRNLENWKTETVSENRRLGELRMRAGNGIIDSLETYYTQLKTKKSERALQQYLKWRLRLHRKWNSHPEFLEELDQSFDIGLCDETVGKTFWEVPPEESLNVSNGYNWRRDSGHALKGRRPQNPHLEK